MSAPRLLLCAPASGGGKTTVTCALLQALVNRGVKPAAFKCGPDYIDPLFHSEIIGARSRSLDLFFLSEETARYLLERGGREAGLALIEGAMGYYDGVAMSSQASAGSPKGRSTAVRKICSAPVRTNAVSSPARGPRPGRRSGKPSLPDTHTVPNSV